MFFEWIWFRCNNPLYDIATPQCFWLILNISYVLPNDISILEIITGQKINDYVEQIPMILV